MQLTPQQMILIGLTIANVMNNDGITFYPEGDFVNELEAREAAILKLDERLETLSIGCEIQPCLTFDSLRQHCPETIPVPPMAGGLRCQALMQHLAVTQSLAELSNSRAKQGRVRTVSWLQLDPREQQLHMKNFFEEIIDKAWPLVRGNAMTSDYICVQAMKYINMALSMREDFPVSYDFYRFIKDFRPRDIFHGSTRFNEIKALIGRKPELAMTDQNLNAETPMESVKAHVAVISTILPSMPSSSYKDPDFCFTYARELSSAQPLFSSDSEFDPEQHPESFAIKGALM